MIATTQEDALLSVQKNSWTSHYIGPYLNNADFLKLAVAYDSRVLNDAPYELRNERRLMIELIKINPRSFPYASEALTHDRNFIKEVMINFGVSVLNLPYELQNDLEFIEYEKQYYASIKLDEPITLRRTLCKKFTRKPSSTSK